MTARSADLQPAILARLAGGPTTAADLWHHTLAAGIDCTEATVRRNLRHLQYRGLVERPFGQVPCPWALTSDGAETHEILRCVS